MDTEIQVVLMVTILFSMQVVVEAQVLLVQHLIQQIIMVAQVV
jgi:hypothetical protein